MSNRERRSTKIPFRPGWIVPGVNAVVLAMSLVSSRQSLSAVGFGMLVGLIAGLLCFVLPIAGFVYQVIMARRRAKESEEAAIAELERARSEFWPSFAGACVLGGIVTFAVVRSMLLATPGVGLGVALVSCFSLVTLAGGPMLLKALTVELTVIAYDHVLRRMAGTGLGESDRQAMEMLLAGRSQFVADSDHARLMPALEQLEAVRKEPRLGREGLEAAALLSAGRSI